MKGPLLVLFLLQAGITIRAQNLDSIAYEIIGQRQQQFGAEEVSSNLDSLVDDYRKRYAKVVSTITDRVTVDTVGREIFYPKTKYETVAQRTQINSIIQRSYAVLRKYKIDSSKVYFSNVFCPCFNAQSIHLKEEDTKLKNRWLIEYNIGFNFFAHKTGLFTANLSPNTGNIDSISLDAQAYGMVITNFDSFHIYDNLFTFLLGDIGSALNIESDSINLEKCKNPVIAGSLSSGFSTFTLYHELAHIILDHHAQINYLSIINGAHEKKIKIPNYFRFEYEADSLGLKIMLDELSNEIDIYNKIPTSAISVPYIFSPLVFFSWLDILQTFENTIAGTHRGASTHPPAKERRERLYRIYERKKIGVGSLNYADFVEGQLKFMYDIIKQMLSKEVLDSINALSKMVRQCKIN